MSKKKVENKVEKSLEKKAENIGEVLSSSEQFIAKNQKLLLYSLIAVIAIVCVVVAYNKLYKAPKVKKAEAALYIGERYFEQGKDSLALFGNDNDYFGFENVIKEFSGTGSANLAHAYAGISYKRIGDNKKALEHLTKFNGKDINIASSVNGVIGDIYMDMGETDKAISSFLKAVKLGDTQMIAPIYLKKAGLAYMHIKNYDKAIETFNVIKDKYNTSVEAADIDKFIEEALILKK